MTDAVLDFLAHVVAALTGLFADSDALVLAYMFIPFVLFLELPLNVLIWLGVLRHYTRQIYAVPTWYPYTPRITCIVTCYAEGYSVQGTVRSLLEQVYPGQIEIIAVVDGADQNRETLQALRAMEAHVDEYASRRLVIVPKVPRGGRVSSLNAGLNLARGEIVMAVDADTSFDNTMAQQAAGHFRDPNVIAMAGSLRVRNWRQNMLTRFQALEYMITIHLAKVGLGEFRSINNISGAFGVFRTEMVRQIGGWTTGSAEDLDLTLRLKQYFGRHPGFYIPFEPRAIGHTDVPGTVGGLLKQRLRWDGDLFYMYVRKHRHAFSPRQMGWWNLIIGIWFGMLFQMVMPILIVLYTLWLVVVAEPSVVAAAFVVIMGLYAVLTALLYITALVFISERRITDLRLAWLIPVFPFYALAVRVWSLVAIVNEWWRHSNQESSMAPWWVLRKSKR
ncbi:MULTISPECIES: glycosyltransferase [unclassified Thioalkalivibrio]|uniref:glycosyltransferase family 2 protein n=1 Tax=unclassified Thioalkalivibrio TaxID=2621013 RepID=UPI0003698ADB|nr:MULTISPECIES: glycosyltransferase [unclassified Thioalkalivibrio]